MLESNKPQNPQVLNPNDPQSGTNGARRRLLRIGLGAAPVLMTLASRPVLGNGRSWQVVGGAQCVAPSGFASMPTSHPGRTYYCSGRTPGYWKQPQHFGSWVAPYFPTSVGGPGGHDATLFNAVFSVSQSPYPDTTTLLQVLDPLVDGGVQGAGPPNDVARHIVAALLNAAAGWTPVLTIAMVQGIWSEYMNTGGGTAGYFEPTAGVKWYHDDIVNYLLSTMPL